MDKEKLNTILKDHTQYLINPQTGKRAYLQDAYLQGAYLQNAYLQNANLQDAKLPHFQIPNGTLIVYKKIQRHIVTLRIPEHAIRTASLVSRKCRSSEAYVIDIEGTESVTTRELTYTTGETVFPDSYNDDIRIECTHGIHFFLTRAEAEEWT